MCIIPQACLIFIGDLWFISTVAIFFFAAKKHGLDDVSSDVANLVSHATQERLRDLLEKLDTIAEHRIEIFKVNKHTFVGPYAKKPSYKFSHAVEIS